LANGLRRDQFRAATQLIPSRSASSHTLIYQRLPPYLRHFKNHQSAILPLPLLSITPLATSGRTTAGQPYLSDFKNHQSLIRPLPHTPRENTLGKVI
jgi:hypothetical protein